MELKTGFSKMKGSPDAKLHFFVCEQGANGKPVLIVDGSAIKKDEQDEVIKTAKKKNKCVGTMTISEKGYLTVIPKGSQPSWLAVALTLSTKQGNVANTFEDIVIGAEAPEQEKETSESQSTEGGAIPEAPPPPPPPPPGKAPAPKKEQAAPEPLDPKFVEKWKTVKATWQSASDAIDNQITKLQSNLKKSGDPELEDIAEYGLNAVTGNFKVPLMAAIRAVDTSAPANLKKNATTVLTVVKGFQGFINGEGKAVIDACDEDAPKTFNVGGWVSIRKTLNDAFTEMENTLKTVV